eukprot:GHVU01223097.1.p2 GENE.GHVU01223097.1~~GHVU01223097.1.p2  ORF type:complete len:232 (-),score=35.92 GHVU01223097.1:835-1530(-)
MKEHQLFLVVSAMAMGWCQGIESGQLEELKVGGDPRLTIDVVVTVASGEDGEEETKVFKVEHPKYFLGLFGAEKMLGYFIEWNDKVLQRRHYLESSDDDNLHGFEFDSTCDRPKDGYFRLHMDGTELRVTTREDNDDDPAGHTAGAYTWKTKPNSPNAKIPKNLFIGFSPVLPMRLINVNDTFPRPPLAVFMPDTLQFNDFTIKQSADGILSLETQGESKTQEVTSECLSW